MDPPSYPAKEDDSYPALPLPILREVGRYADRVVRSQQVLCSAGHSLVCCTVEIGCTDHTRGVAREREIALSV